MNSIRQRLLLWLIVGMLISTGIAGLSMYLLAQDEANELFDYQIKQIALSLPGSSQLPVVTADDEDPEEDNVIQVWDAQGKPLFVSYPSRALPRYVATGLHTVNYRQQPWRLYNTQRRGQFIQVAQPMTVREELAAALALRMLMPFFVLIPLLAGLIWWSVGRSLRPMQDVTTALATRHADAMQPLDETDLPQEIKPMVIALNQLLMRLDQAMQSQRAFVADAAHELRSPLTALKLQLQLTERTSGDEQRTIAFTKLNQRVDRSIHLVQQLLTLARSEPRLEQAQFTDVDLSALAYEVAQDFMPLAEAHQTELRLELQPDVRVSGQQVDLRTLISNLVDNAIRYSSDGSQVRLCVARETGHAVLQVIDNGSGIPADERERVFDRFYRREGTEVIGSGLGLAIVRNIAAVHHADLELSDNSSGSGLVVTVIFPL
ncbi:ATP-binding protein [Sulfuriferula nivalis]|uniref:histidine kinase n=1 Tax=Sulfuriferula nivalis TaxID=2675298 RepID=A0A809RDA7_9PROT|nr:ATP-binding protein [Sulfuriferula nivalis]BBO99635.1 two-component sensor histidine kinase [Sulfuriferula nivalis]